MKVLVAFSSPKRSYQVVKAAANYSKAIGGELVLLRVLPDPQKVGVVAQLIATDRPHEKAQSQIQEVEEKLKIQGINVTGIVKIGEVAKEIIKVCSEIKADILFLGTAKFAKPGLFFIQRDPIVRYLVDNCPINLCLIRHDDNENFDPSDLDKFKL